MGNRERRTGCSSPSASGCIHHAFCTGHWPWCWPLPTVGRIDGRQDLGNSESGAGSTFHFNHRRRAVEFPATDGVAVLAGKRILIVDDLEVNRRILGRQLVAWGAVVQTAGSGSEALGVLERGEVFDLAVLDMQMPEMDGIQLAEEICRRNGSTQLPFSDVDLDVRQTSWQWFSACWPSR